MHAGQSELVEAKPREILIGRSLTGKPQAANGKVRALKLELPVIALLPSTGFGICRMASKSARMRWSAYPKGLRTWHGV